MHVLKFGGTSMGDEKSWRQVLDIVSKYDRPVVVVSATARTTRQLLSAAETALNDLDKALEISKGIQRRHENLVLNFMSNYPDRQVQQACLDWIHRCTDTLNVYLKQTANNGALTANIKDALASIGEQMSSYLFARCGSVYGLNMQWIDARRIIKTDSEFGKANPDSDQIEQSVQLLTDTLGKNQIPVMGGYYGEDQNGNVTTLGFEGSDFTASLVGSALDAEAIEIWTDVSGIFTCDPRLVSDAQTIRELSFQEATEMAYFGAKVLHPSTMKPASRKQIPIFVKNIFESDHPGTRVHTQSKSTSDVKAITFIDEVTIVTISSDHVLMGYQFLSQVFAMLEELRIPVDVVTTTEASVSVALTSTPPVSQLYNQLKHLGEVSFSDDQALISLVGCSFQSCDTISRKILGVISEFPLTMLSYSQAKNNLNLVLPKDHLHASVRAIHASLFPVSVSKPNGEAVS